MHIHILGICGTFMGGIAILARAMGYDVTGSDENVYPPMSTQLEEQGIKLIKGFDPEQLNSKPDIVVIGNSLSRGNPCVEALLNKNMNYVSGPEFLANNILKDKHVIAISGTHGKTSTSSMLAWILEYAKIDAGFLIGGIPMNFGVSARLGSSKYFVVEADEYDSAFFDKRSKFVHYKPNTLVINNIEYDHADIFPNIEAIQKQFHHLIRTVPSKGTIIWPERSSTVAEVIRTGCWSKQQLLDTENKKHWHSNLLDKTGQRFNILYNKTDFGLLEWKLIGMHNVENAIMAVAAAKNIGVDPKIAIEALMQFIPPKRRLEKIADINNISIYDDFAHHPTAIAATLSGMRAKFPTNRIIAVLEPRSNTMKLGVHKDTMPRAIVFADHAFFYQDQSVTWDIRESMKNANIPVMVSHSITTLIQEISSMAKKGDQIVIMSNGGFLDFHKLLVKAIENKNEPQ